MPTGARIEFDRVKKSYKSTHALRDFSLSVENGEFLTILGSSGSGKTTVLNAMAGFSPADEGDIRVDGKSIIGLPPERRNLGMVFQNYSLFPHMTVFDNVAFPLRMARGHGFDIKSRVAEVLQIVRLEGYGDRMPRELSGGQQQRVAFARAIATAPPTLLMDEPLGALDLKLREALQFEIKEIQHKLGCTVIYVTHDQREALAMSSRIVVLRDGKIEQIGTPTDMYDRPRTRFIADFIGQTNLLKVDVGASSTFTLPEIGASFRAAVDGDPYAFAYASIRPERIRRGPAQGNAIEMSAVVQEAVFLGDVVEYSARTESGLSLFFREQRGSVGSVAERGAEVRLHFVPEEVVFVQDS